MELNEVTITSAIIDRFHEKLKDSLEADVAVVGGGPSGLVAGYYLAKAGKRCPCMSASSASAAACGAGA